MYIDKQTVARLLIHASIRSAFHSECPIANHLVVMSARQIMNEYASAHNITLTADMRMYLKDKSFAKKFDYLWKTRYNFFKHADEDYDEEVQITNISLLNELETLLNIEKYKQLFGSQTHHMNWFGSYLVMLYPDKFNLGDHATVVEGIKRAFDKMGKSSRVSLREAMALMLTRNIDIVAETEETRQLSIQEPVQIPEEEKDKFRRKKQSE